MSFKSFDCQSKSWLRGKDHTAPGEEVKRAAHVAMSRGWKNEQDEDQNDVLDKSLRLKIGSCRFALTFKWDRRDPCESAEVC